MTILHLFLVVTGALLSLVILLLIIGSLARLLLERRELQEIGKRQTECRVYWADREREDD